MPSSSKTTETYANSISKPFSKVEGVPRKDHDHFTTSFSNGSLLTQISQQIKALDVQSLSTSCMDKTCSQIEQHSSSETEEVDTEDSDEATINVISKTFEEDTELALNKINYGNKSTMRNYYSRPSPPDLQYEERFTMNHFDGQSVYTWNIDGKSEHEILNTLQEMAMACIAYKARRLDPRDQAVGIIQGFQGQLKY